MNEHEALQGSIEEYKPELSAKDSAALLALQRDVLAEWIKKEHKDGDARIEWIDQYAERARKIFESEGERLLAMIRDGHADRAVQEIKNRLYH
jgi:hypothetical protein